MSDIARTQLDPSTQDRFLSLRRALDATAIGINQMLLQPGQRMRVHRHQHQEEIYLVLEGELTVVTADDELRLGRYELARLAPSVKRQLVNRGPEPVLLVALGGAGEHESRDAEAFSSWEDETPRSPRDVPLPDDLPT